MSSRSIERRPWSIQGRLLLLFAAGATTLLIGISASLYVAIVHYMEGRAEVFLADKLADAEEDMTDPGGIQEEANDLAVPTKGEPVCWIRILDATGRTLGEMQKMAQRVPIGEFPAPPASGLGRRDYVDGNGRWMSLATLNAMVAGAKYTIQVAEDRRADAEFLRELRWMLLGLTAAGALVSGVLALWVIRRGLRPLGEMEQALLLVSAPRLNERLGKLDWPRELRPLAAAFDAMLDRLEDSFTRLSRFSADLAHELRTPLAILRGEAEVALTRSRSAEEYRQVIESSMEEYERLAEIVGKLLFLARADAEEAEVKAEELEAGSIVDALLEFYEPYAEESCVMLKREGHGIIKADRILLRRASANLIENALHFTPTGGQVTVEVREGGIVAVKDSGCGIAPEHLPRLFDRFYQVDTARRGGGTGLGLALVKSIMNLHGGTVTITSELGQGTEVTLFFPA
jgi:two-component system heavy metal sensor histidine kinase CusS